MKKIKILHVVPYPGPKRQNKIFDVIIDRCNCFYEARDSKLSIERIFF